MRILGSERLINDYFKEEFQKPFQNFKFSRKYFYSSGRGAIKNLAYFLKKNRYSIFFPDYYCAEMFKPLKDENVKIEFYRILPDFTADIKFLKKVKKEKTALYIVDYFGFQDENLIEFSKESGFLSVRDVTHSLLSNFDFSSSDIVLGSLRKLFPVVDGGILFTNLKNFEILKKNSKEDFYIDKLLAKLYREIYERYKYKSEHFEKMYLNYSLKGEEGIGYLPKSISKFSLNLLKIYDFEKVGIKRRKNFNILLSNSYILKKAIFKSLPKEVVPQSFPIKIEKRDLIKKELQKYKIFIPILWRCKNEISENILNIPIDEDYSKKDLLNSVDKIKKVSGDKDEC